MNKQILFIFFAILILLFINFALADNELSIESATFPDEYFRSYIQKYFDKDNSGTLSSLEISNVIRIDITSINCTNLQGIEYFNKLEKLFFTGTQIECIDLRSNNELRELTCYKNKISVLYLGNNNHLEKINCHDNLISELDLCGCTTLQELVCYNNQIHELNLNNNPLLTTLDCDNNCMSELSIINNPDLNNLSCNNNQLDEIFLSNVRSLSWLECYNNRLSNLNLNAVTKCEHLSCYGNNISYLNISNCPTLISVVNTEEKQFSVDYFHYGNSLYCDLITEIITNKPSGEYIAITSEYFPDNSFRKYIFEMIDGDGDMYLSSSEIDETKSINISGKGISSLDGINIFSNLNYLDCSDNNLIQLDVSKNIQLRHLECQENKFNSISLPLGIKSIINAVYYYSGNTYVSYEKYPFMLKCDKSLHLDLTKSISLSSGIITIEEEAFSYINSQFITFNGDNITIGGKAFSNCLQLEAVNLCGCSISSIADDAFINCDNLTILIMARDVNLVQYCLNNGLKYICFEE